MFKKIALVLVAALAGLFVVIAMQPAEYHVERTLEIEAPPEVVFALVNDFKQFSRYSPWDAADPELKRTFSAETSGVGATYGWSGNTEVGSGSMTITEATAPTKLTMRLDFKEPMASTATAGFLIAKTDTGSKATWYVDGENNFVGKGFCLFMDINAKIGEAYEQGLARLNTAAKEDVAAAAKAKAEAEALAAAAAAAAKAEADAAAAEGTTVLTAGKP